MSADGADRADRLWMEQALALAVLGEGSASPNPCVGCVVVRGGRVVGRGYHRAAGEPHAEATAVLEAGEEARGATAFVNLEPCSHHGRTPPCADLLIRHGVARVVASITDPNPLVDGKGFRRLREAGIEVEVGLLADEARRLNAAFLLRQTAMRPLVTLKAGVSADGMIAAASGVSRWITGEAARRFAHRLRHGHDAVLVGAGTVRRDDPELLVRLPGVAPAKLRAVLAPALDLPPAARVLVRQGGSPPTRIYAARNGPLARAGLPSDGGHVVVGVPCREGALDLAAVLADLREQGVQSVLAEGGGRTLAGFLAAGLADRAALFCAPLLVGARGATPLLNGRAAPDPSSGWRVEDVERIPLGDDLLLLGKLRRPQAAAS